ncbi:outer membrane protein assembly factor BamB family protein [Anaeromyxobacter diazotrophicus]|uniref:Pyrrolo-quinoline quinone repeat domain-containing protein n=1 Tax=Anaeromyxobacter diazotrophicus TaxID=2590199 RepID=A0A7I9VMW9_9BACT|nr:PQQ-binding-like beta-propeller repeat protein [Anaeromyxobacter diazotrophicus]GEJ57558.1 hypothetical protein AMYX_22990 [Anaeromyxobacter diazotrophicus]
MRLLFTSLVAIGLACGGGSAPGGCRANAECGAGLVCVVPASGQPGTCQKPPIAIALTAPPAGARAGAAGLAVTARVTLAAADGVPPPVALVVDGAEVGPLAQSARDGAVVSYAGTYLPPAGLVATPTLFVVARTSAGVIPSDGVFVDVDTKPPVLKRTVGPACGTRAACPRDGAIDLFVAVAEDHPGVVEATVDLDGHQLAIPFQPAAVGTDLTVAVPLAKYPFPRFSGTVKVRVHARDAFGNEAVLDDLPAFPVTRLRWTKDLRDASQSALKVTGAAVRSSGEVVVGASDGKLRVVSADGAGLLPTTVSSFAISSAPSLGASTIWVGSDDGKLYGYSESDGVAFGCPSTAAVGAMFTPAVVSGTPELVFSAGGASAIYGMSADKKCLGGTGVSTTDPVTTASISKGGKLFLLTSRAARSTLRRYSTGLAEEASGATSCGTVATPPAIDQDGHILLACAGGEIVKCDATTLAPTLLATLSDYAPESIVLFPGGDLLVGTNDHKLHRLTPPATGTGAWTDAWSALPALTSSVRGVLVAEQDRDGVVAYAVTADGQLYALAADGQARWSTVGEVSAPLGISPLTFPTIAPAASASQLPTLYAGSDDGHLYAVVVDSALDPRSPWPKSHHDARNSGDAGAPVYP